MMHLPGQSHYTVKLPFVRFRNSFLSLATDALKLIYNLQIRALIKNPFLSSLLLYIRQTWLSLILIAFVILSI